MPRILVVDDDPSTADLLRDELAPWQIEIVATSAVHAAVELLVHGTFAALVLDLTVAEATGFDILDAMRHTNVTTRAIITSRRLPEYANYLLSPIQVLTIMKKPFDTDLMIAAILGLCGIQRDFPRPGNASATSTESEIDL